MKTNLSKKILCSIIAMGVLGTANYAMANSVGGNDNNLVIGEDTYDAYIGKNGASDNKIDYSSAEHDFIAGGYAEDASDVKNNVVNISTGRDDSKEIKYVFAGFSNTEDFSNLQNNELVIENSNLTFEMLSGGCAYYYGESGNAKNNTVKIKDSTLKHGETILSFISGGTVQNGISSENNIIIENSIIDEDSVIYVNGGHINNKGIVEKNNVVIKSLTINKSFLQIHGGFVTGESLENKVVNNSVIIDSITRNEGSGVFITGGFIHFGNAESNTLTINGGDFYELDKICASVVNYNGSANSNILNINDGTFKGDVYGAYVRYFDSDRDNSCSANDNTLNINGGTFEGNIYGAYLEDGSNELSNDNNVVKVSGNVDVSNANIFGIFDEDGIVNGINNRLVVDSWTGKVNSISNFDKIEFENINWNNEGTVLNIAKVDDSNLENTGIDLKSLNINGGQTINTGDYMNLVAGDKSLEGISVDSESHKVDAGVATVVTGKYNFADDNKEIQFVVENVELQSQTDLVAENRAVAAAFINQGTDLINDSLDVLSRDGKYGIKTFAAVHGNRSEYDVNSDLKINGWSSIVGVGNEKDIGNGDFSWGVFYENGSGNYRTYNEFNNEFFRGDGSLVYNGGGIAARFEQDNGVYTEGSLRAGMLKSEMTDALKDGAGNSYGYKSESTYYGAHIGAGKIISLDEDTDLDVYGKFFHTYTDGDSFAVAGDKFEFDSITSDRLRIGARLTTNKENKFSTYYGLAYEYEFNGDADMRVQNMSAPEQSLQGSSYLAEIGMNYKPGSESPWSFDLNMRGYAGQREGASFNLQANYSF